MICSPSESHGERRPQSGSESASPLTQMIMYRVDSNGRLNLGSLRPEVVCSPGSLKRHNTEHNLSDRPEDSESLSGPARQAPGPGRPSSCPGNLGVLCRQSLALARRRAAGGEMRLLGAFFEVLSIMGSKCRRIPAHHRISGRVRGGNQLSHHDSPA
jgi:hypothetical protein